MDTLQELCLALEKANRAALSKKWQSLAEQTLDLLMEISRAEAALLYPIILQDEYGQSANSEEVRMPWRGCPTGLSTVWWEALRAKMAQPSLFRGEHIRWIDRDTVVSEPVIRMVFDNLKTLKNLVILPLKNSRGAASGVLLFNAAASRLDLAGIISSRLATDLEKAAEIEAVRAREARLMTLNDILGQLGASLNPDQVLRMFIERARQFLQVEAVSLFLVDERNGDLVLQMASQENRSIEVEKVRVPAGVGIIGRVTRSGETLLVEDVQHDQRHYTHVDQNSGFVTQSILAVPLRSRPIDLGLGRGMSRERIIGGLEAINKIGGPFMPEDIELLEILAKGASTILVVARMYLDANTMFVDVIQGLVTAIDAKDPYTEGRSQRVSNISAEIARELGMTDEEISQVRLGCLLQDVDTIGVTDHSPGKTDSTTVMGQDPDPQPGNGEEPGPTRILSGGFAPLPDTRIAQTNGEKTSESPTKSASLANSILTVANVFDSMTSARPFKEGMPAKEVLLYMMENIGVRFDKACVEALLHAYQKGRIKIERRS